MIASSFPTPKVQDLLDMNALLRRLKKDAVVLQIFPIPLSRLTGVIFSDASLGNCKDGGSQVCYVACVADQEILEGSETNVSVLAYKSHRMNRSASNVLYTESFGMSDGLASGE